MTWLVLHLTKNIIIEHFQIKNENMTFINHVAGRFYWKTKILKNKGGNVSVTISYQITILMDLSVLNLLQYEGKIKFRKSLISWHKTGGNVTRLSTMVFVHSIQLLLRF